MFEVLVFFGLTFLLSLAASDLLISGYTADELDSMGLRQD